MAVLYYTDFSGLNLEKLISAYADKVDKERLSKLTRTLAPEAKVRSLLAGYLLQIGLRTQLNTQQMIPLQYNYGENGKPYLADYPEIYFGISHSAQAVVCVISQQEVGVDIQKYVAVKENLSRRFFRKEEHAFLEKIKKEHPEDEQLYKECFFRLWSIKESYIKYTGKGMKQGLNTFEILFEKGMIEEQNKTVCFQEINLDEINGYACSVCMELPEKIQLVKVILSENGEEENEQICSV